MYLFVVGGPIMVEKILKMLWKKMKIRKNENLEIKKEKKEKDWQKTPTKIGKNVTLNGKLKTNNVNSVEALRIYLSNHISPIYVYIYLSIYLSIYVYIYLSVLWFDLELMISTNTVSTKLIIQHTKWHINSTSTQKPHFLN